MTSDLTYYDSFISKITQPAAERWSAASEQILVEPYTYLTTAPGKEIRSTLINVFNDWLKVPEEPLAIIRTVVRMLHTASLLIDDVEDNSNLRRGLPAAHKVYGVPQTINSGNYVYFLALEELRKGNFKVEDSTIAELLNLHRGQGMELFWRENLVCPTESEYIDMVNNKTGGLLRVAIRLMSDASQESPRRDYVPLVNLIGIIYQIRDDYINLQSSSYADSKGYCEDFSEGKFSFPIVHSIRADTSNRQILNILRERPTDPIRKAYAVSYMTTQTKSFEYTRAVLDKLTAQAREEVARLGGNRGVEAILDMLVVRADEDTAFPSTSTQSPIPQAGAHPFA